MATGIKALLGAVLTAQRVYYSEFSHLDLGLVSAMLEITPTANKYFRSFSVTGNTTAFTAKTDGTVPANGITIKIRATKTGPYFTEFGLNKTGCHYVKNNFFDLLLIFLIKNKKTLTKNK